MELMPPSLSFLISAAETPWACVCVCVCMCVCVCVCVPVCVTHLKVFNRHRPCQGVLHFLVFLLSGILLLLLHFHSSLLELHSTQHTQRNKGERELLLVRAVRTPPPLLFAKKKKRIAQTEESCLV